MWDTAMNHLIIGNGIAGIEAALSIRKNDPESGIRVLSASRHPHYYRPRLIEYLAGETPLEKLITHKDDFYSKNRIETTLGTVVERIIPGENRVIDSAGNSYSYDTLLLATGASPFLPPFRGNDLEGVYTLRGITDADRIKARCGIPGHVAVIGGGLLGLETAYSLTRLGNRVTVVEYCRRLLPRQLDDEGGAVLLKMLVDKGISFILDDSVLSVDGSVRAESISLKSGNTLPVDAVIVSAGIRCRTDLAARAGLATAGGVIVDDYLRTSVNNIYAAGDPAEHKGKLYGIWPASREQGRVAGLNMAGIETRYSGTLPSNTLKITGIDLYSAGDFNATDCEVLVQGDNAGYRKFLLNKDHPRGAIVLGDREAVKTAQRVLEGKADPEEFKRFF